MAGEHDDVIRAAQAMASAASQAPPATVDATRRMRAARSASPTYEALRISGRLMDAVGPYPAGDPTREAAWRLGMYDAAQAEYAGAPEEPSWVADAVVGQAATLGRAQAEAEALKRAERERVQAVQLADSQRAQAALALEAQRVQVAMHEAAVQRYEAQRQAANDWLATGALALAAGGAAGWGVGRTQRADGSRRIPEGVGVGLLVLVAAWKLAPLVQGLGRPARDGLALGRMIGGFGL